MSSGIRKSSGIHMTSGIPICTTPRKLHMRLGAVAIATALLASACGGDDQGGGVEISGAWARTSPMMAAAGAAYMTIESDEAISIVSVSVPAEVAGVAELHETVPVEGMDDGVVEDEAMEGDEMEEPTMDEPMDQAMTMQQVSSIDVPAGGSASLEPGGFHVMLLELPDPLELGETFDLVLITSTGNEISVPIEVRDQAP